MDAVEAAFGVGKSLYDVLEVASTASPAEIKKGYFRAALKYHPDKCPGDDEAKTKFQALSLVHAVLSDPERRNLYDESGEVTDEGHELSGQDDDTWYEYWRSLFPKVIVADIESFSDKYKGSDEEAQHVLDAYNKHKGDMRAVVDSVMLATDDDEDRFREIIEAAIQRKEARTFSAFSRRRGGGGKTSGAPKNSKRKSRADKEAAEADELLAMIKQRQGKRAGNSLSELRSKTFDNMVSSLEARYGGTQGRGGSKGGKKTKSVQHDELDDEEFARIQSGLGKSRPKR